MCWIMAPTILRVSWKIISSSQAEFTLWTSFAMRLCSRSSKTWMDVTAREGIKNDVRIKSSIKQELRERNPEPTDNYLKSIFSTGNHFLYFEPRTLQVFLFCLFVCLFVCLSFFFFCLFRMRSEWSRQTWMFPQEKRLHRTWPKTGFRGRCSWKALSNQPEFGSGKTVKFDATYEHNLVMSQLGFNEIRLTLANWFYSVVTLFVNALKIYGS